MAFAHHNNILHVDDLSFEDIARDFTSPCYVYSTRQITENYKTLDTACQKHISGHDPLIAYACKANSTLAILSTLAKMGSGADIVSGGEMRRALAAGIPADKIVFSGVGKKHDEIADAIDHQIAQINIESEAEMALISEIAHDKKKSVRVSFRMNPDVDAKTNAKITTGKKDSKFGVAAEVIRELYKHAADDTYLEPQGVSVHIGSQLTTLDPFQKAFAVVADFVRTLQSDGHRLKTLDLGGGIGIPYENEGLFDLDDYFKIIQSLIAPFGTRIILEPGRSITGNSGALLSRVLFFKKAGDKNFLVVDAGMTDFMRPSLYEATHPVFPVDLSTASTKTYDIVGPVCETTDILATSVDLPEVIEKPGSLLAFMMAGAYGSVMASLYNARSLPSEILVNGSTATEIRSRLTADEMMSREKIPDWLEKSA